MRRILLVLGLLVAAVSFTTAAATETPTGSIDVDKTVHGDPDCPDDEPCFVVVIDCADQIDRRQVYDRTGHLIEGPSTFHRIPTGTVCTVVETVTGGATVTYDPVGADTAGVVVTPEDPDSDVDQRVHVMVTNTFCKRDCVPPPTTTVPTTTSTTTTSTTTSTTAPPPPPTSSIPPHTTVPPPPTTDPPTTTVPPTTDPTTTTTTAPPPPTTDPGPPPTTDPVTTTVPPELPRTGSDHLRPWAAAGLILATLGVALVVVTRKRVTG
jgi:LPXTG-motif cell wall-anchored protein